MQLNMQNARKSQNTASYNTSYYWTMISIVTNDFMTILGLVLRICFMERKTNQFSECTSIKSTQIHQRVSTVILPRPPIHTHAAADSPTRSAAEPPCSLRSCRSDAFHGNSVPVGGPDVWWRANASLIRRHRGRLVLSSQTMTLAST